MSTNDSTPTSAPSSEVFDLLSYSRAVYIQPKGAAKATAAITGLQTILALLHQREIDADAGCPNGLTFGAHVAAGLICAATACAELMTQITDGEHPSAHSFEPGSAGERVMNEAIGKATQADHMLRNRGGGSYASE
jgi:hypothetical protein